MGFNVEGCHGARESSHSDRQDCVVVIRRASSQTTAMLSDGEIEHYYVVRLILTVYMITGEKFKSTILAAVWAKQ